MIALAIHLCAIVLVAGAEFLVASTASRKPSAQLAILIAGMVGGVAMAASGLRLFGPWRALMEHVDFVPLDQINVRRLPSPVYFAPSLGVAIGVVAATVFTRRLYRFLEDR